jgi:opacity protein-like surface antigen
MRPIRTLALIAGVLVLHALTPASARADATAFIGTNTTPSSRPVKGLALGFGLLIVAFEFEYATTSEDVDGPAAPALKTGMGNVLLQTPVSIFRLQPYFTTGGGMYRETLGSHQDTSFGTNVGGGVKVSLAGPLRLRVDYRVFKLGSGALNSPAHRVYAGLNLSF